MHHYLKDLYAILKILVAFTFIIFFSAFYFITDDKKGEVQQQPQNVFYCGTTARELGYGLPDSASAVVMKGYDLFQNNCTACHAIHKIKVGPALKDISKRRSHKWIISFVRNPMRKIKLEKDPYAVALYNQYYQTEMTAFSSLKKSEIEAIISYIDEVSSPKGY